MRREIIRIDEDKCTGCGLCIPNCHEGALQIIEGKARLISELMCDGLGNCLGYCPEDAIKIETRDAADYDEVLVIKEMIPKGVKTIKAHLLHLKDHKQVKFLDLGVDYLTSVKDELDFDVDKLIDDIFNPKKEEKVPFSLGGCPGSASKMFAPKAETQTDTKDIPSALTHWPVQMHLINPMAPHFAGSDFLLAADCVAFSLGGFHGKLLKGKTLGIACPKLDDGAEIYIDKLVSLIDTAKINTVTIVIMEVPCCGGLLQMAKVAASKATRKVPVKSMVISISGEVLSEEWV